VVTTVDTDAGETLTGLGNGSHTLRVRACNETAECGAWSEAVEAVVSIASAPEGVPALTGGAADAGDSTGLTTPFEGVVALWRLSRVEDRFGNDYTLSYEEDAGGADHRLLAIDYTGNVGQGLAPYARVELAYEALAQVLPKYHAGIERAQAKRLTAIRTSVDGAPVTAYLLGYDEGETVPAAGLSRLTSVARCAPDAGGSCTAPPASEPRGYSGHEHLRRVRRTVPAGSVTLISKLS